MPVPVLTPMSKNKSKISITLRSEKIDSLVIHSVSSPAFDASNSDICEVSGLNLPDVDQNGNWETVEEKPVKELITFSPDAFKHISSINDKGAKVQDKNKYTNIGRMKCLSFKMLKNESRLVKTVFHSYGFEQASPHNMHFNVLWTGTHLRPHCLRSLFPWQRVNHFPRTFELTRKDKLYENVARAQTLFGASFHIVPEFFVTPRDIDKLATVCNAGRKSLGPFIVKPVGSSRGRGIFLATRPEQIPLGSSMLVSRYISNPYLINGHKFDIRLYVVVTSFHPLVVYLYNEGMARFATEKYVVHVRAYNQQHVHLTNYSLNKHSRQYVRNERADAENTGHKWTLSAVLRHLADQGHDTELLMLRIEDLVVKTLLSVQSCVAAACHSYVAHPDNCFELFGFDILLDVQLKPWLLEVNLSPSLSCDSPLDLALKSRMICDILTMAAIPVVNPHEFDVSILSSSPSVSRAKSSTQRSALLLKVLCSNWTPVTLTNLQRQAMKSCSSSTMLQHWQTDSDGQQRFHRVRQQMERKGGFVRIFPSVHSHILYTSVMEDIGPKWDEQLHEHLYGRHEDDDQLLAEKAGQQLMDVVNISDRGDLDDPVFRLFQSALVQCGIYSKRKTVLGGHYPACLPRVRLSARKRTKSLLELLSSPQKRHPLPIDSDLILSSTAELDSQFPPKPPVKLSPLRRSAIEKPSLLEARLLLERYLDLIFDELQNDQCGFFLSPITEKLLLQTEILTFDISNSSEATQVNANRKNYYYGLRIAIINRLRVYKIRHHRSTCRIRADLETEQQRQEHDKDRKQFADYYHGFTRRQLEHVLLTIVSKMENG